MKNDVNTNCVKCHERFRELTTFKDGHTLVKQVLNNEDTITQRPP